MLTTIPTREQSKPRSWTIPVLIGLVITLFMAFSSLAALYYTNILIDNPDIIVVNQTPSNNSTNTNSIGTISTKSKTNISDENTKNKQNNNKNIEDNSNKQDYSKDLTNNTK